MQTGLRWKAKTERKITHWPKTKNGRHVHRVLQNAQGNTWKNAIKNLAPTVGQRVRPPTYQENERPQRIV